MKLPRYVYLLVFLMLAVFVFACLVNKAQYSSLTTEESASYLATVRSSAGEAQAYSSLFVNTHPLDSFLMRLSASVFGPTELSLRLPNLLLFLVYALFATWLVWLLPEMLAAGMYLLLLTHPTMLESFGLAQGYGLGSALMLAGIYYAFVVLHKRTKVDVWLFHAAFVLAVLSNYCFLNAYLVAIVGLHLLLYLQGRDQDAPRPGLREILNAEILPLGLAVLLLYVPVRHMVTANLFDSGGKGGFWETTVLGFAERWWHGMSLPPVLVTVIAVLVVSVLGAGLFTLALAVRRGEKRIATNYAGLIFTQVLIWGIALAFVAQHVLLGQEYPVGRFLTSLFPPFALQLGLVLHHNRGWMGLRRWSGWAMLALGLLSLGNFVMNAPRDAYREWESDAETSYMMGVMAEDHDFHAPGRRGTQLGVNRLFAPTANFYRLTRNLDWLAPVKQDGIGLSDDYVYEFDSLWKQPDTAFVSVERFARTGTTLWRRKSGLVP